MDDRELLELAAKAAGIAGGYHEAATGTGIHWRCGIWNPLTDDGDALRLAVKLEINLRYGEKKVTAEYQDNSGEWIAYVIDYYVNFEVGDPYAATRRAIVRAAAEIGKEMK